jgi:hypothetical protein
VAWKKSDEKKTMEIHATNCKFLNDMEISDFPEINFSTLL